MQTKHCPPARSRQLHFLWFPGFVLLGSLSGCLNSLDDRRQTIDAPPGTRTPVVQGLLDPSSTIQTIWVEWSIPADSTWQGQPRPVDPSLVTLHLVGPDSTPVPLVLAASGEYTAQLQVYPDSIYRLTGTIGDSLVMAEVRLPDSVRIQEPAADTVRIARQEGFKLPLPYAFEATGATVYFMVQRQDNLAFRLFGTTGLVNLIAFRDDTLAVRVEAYEPHGGEWVFAEQRPPSTSNIRGAYGYLGGVVQSRVIIVIPQ